MKKSILFTAIIFVLAFNINAQNDTMYIMKSGIVVNEYNVNTQIDSIIFYKPNTGISNTVTDFDGNVYNTVTIGTQVWMAENLRTTHYAYGTPINLVNDGTSWNALTTDDKAYCWYNDDSVTNAAQYGALYTWNAAMNGAESSVANPSIVQGVCPTGWHLPSYDEWTMLTDYLTNHSYGYEGSGNDIGKSMAATSGWSVNGTPGNVGNDQASNNTSGFTAVPSGYRQENGIFTEIGEYGYWWHATETSPAGANFQYLGYDISTVENTNYTKRLGLSVRCVKD